MKKASNIRSIPAIFFIIAVFLVLVSGCKNKPQTESDITIPDLEPKNKEELIEELSGYPIPTSYEIADLAFRAGAPYLNDVPNPPSKVGEYITQDDKALNLGVYGADLCYASTHGMKHWTMLFLESSQTLIDELGISTSFNSDYTERIEQNLDDRDSVINIVSDSFVDTWDYLVDNQQDVLARLVVCGSWIEGIYITTNIAKYAKNNTEYLEILATQKNSLDKLVSLMEPVKDLDEVNEIFKGLFDLQDIYSDVGEALTAEQLEMISTRIEALRESLV